MERGLPLCGYCGATLGEPPRRSGMTQRALALDEDAAKAALEAAARTAPPAPAPATQLLASRPPKWSFWDRLFVVLTLGFGWIWLRRRDAQLA